MKVRYTTSLQRNEAGASNSLTAKRREERGEMESSLFSISPHIRHHVLEFLIYSSAQLHLSPIVKYTALSLFSDRFFPYLQRFAQDNDSGNWLLHPLRECNLQLFALISIWISSKMHDTGHLSVKSLKSFSDKNISDQHFTMRDFAEAELVFLKVLRFEIGASNIAFVFLEELLIQFREIAKVGEILNFDVCMDIIDLLYEAEETSALFHAPRSLAASILVASYCLSVPKQTWEFPLLPWGRSKNGTLTYLLFKVPCCTLCTAHLVPLEPLVQATYK